MVSAIHIKRRNAGLCIKCGSPSTEIRCKPCRDYLNAKLREKIKLRKALGLCTNCGVSTDNNGFTCCNTCLRVKRIEKQRSRKRKNELRKLEGN